jgi:hypothetical protein
MCETWTSSLSNGASHPGRLDFPRQAIPNEASSEAIRKTKNGCAPRRVVTERLKLAPRIFDSFSANPQSA